MTAGTVPAAEDLADPGLRAAVTELIADGVRGGAALGWLEPPDAAAVGRLLDDLAARSSRGDAAVRLAWDGATVVGIGFWRRYDRPSLAANADLEKVLVAESHRGRGHGRVLVEGLLDDAGRAGIETLTLDVRGDNHGAIALYERLGFTECGRVHRFVAWGGQRFDRVTMALRLAAPAEGSAAAVATHLVGWLVLRRPDGRVLLGRRSGVTYAAGLWGLPGGHAERGETWAAAAVRETREEVGLIVREDDLVPLGVSRYDDGGQQGVDVFFLTERWQGVPEPLAECSEVGWFDPDDLPPDALPWLGHALRTHLRDRTWLDDAAALQTPGGAAG